MNNTSSMGLENTPGGNRSHSGSHKQYGSAQAKAEYGGMGMNASAGATGKTNIFAMDHSAGSNVQAFTTSHMTSGSPAFGLPE